MGEIGDSFCQSRRRGPAGAAGASILVSGTVVRQAHFVYSEESKGFVPSDNTEILQMLSTLHEKIVACTRCTRLCDYTAKVAETKRRAYRDWDYWGRPVPSFGDPKAKVLVLGLAPGAHGSNRTGRMFTGDRSGDILYKVLHKTRFASQASSVSRDDGLTLTGLYITAAAHCAPPGNKPLPEELRNCRPFLEEELTLLRDIRVVVALGKIAFDVYLDILKTRGVIASRAPYQFGHNLEYEIAQGYPRLLASYHPSQQNTSTGKLTEKMLTDVFRRARKLAGLSR
jgi:uracil-DNA glycosylase family 4